MSIWDNWNYELLELKQSLNLVANLAREPTYEIQNALVHLLIALRETASERRKELKRAIAHIRRAHLDSLKIKLFEIYSDFENHAEIDTQKTLFIQFKKEFAKARLYELQSFEQHNKIISNFRVIIQKYQNHTNEIRYTIPDSPQAQTDNNYAKLDSNTCKLFWEWVQLEILHTSLLGQRVYDVVYNMVEAYLQWTDFEKVLRQQIATLKILIFMIVIQLDSDKVIENKITNIDPNNTILTDIHSLYKNEDTELFTIRLINNIDKPFQCTLEFLDVSFADLPGQNYTIQKTL